MSEVGPVYRLTEAGWNEIHRSHQMTIMPVWVGLASLLAAALTAR